MAASSAFSASMRISSASSPPSMISLAPPEGGQGQRQRRHLDPRSPARARDASHPGAEPAQVDVEIVAFAVVRATGHLLHLEGDVAAHHELALERRRLALDLGRGDGPRRLDRLRRLEDLPVELPGGRDVPHVVAAELEEKAARLVAVLREGPELLPGQIGDHRLARRVGDPGRADGRAYDRELEHLAAIVAALAAPAHRDHALAQAHADHRVGAHEGGLLVEPRDGPPPRLAVRVADDGDLAGRALVVGDLAHEIDAAPHDLRDGLALHVPREHELAHRQIAREEPAVRAGLGHQALLGAERNAALRDVVEARGQVDAWARVHQPFTERTS